MQCNACHQPVVFGGVRSWTDLRPSRHAIIIFITMVVPDGAVENLVHCSYALERGHPDVGALGSCCGRSWCLMPLRFGCHFIQDRWTLRVRTRFSSPPQANSHVLVLIPNNNGCSFVFWLTGLIRRVETPERRKSLNCETLLMVQLIAFDLNLAGLNFFKLVGN